MSKPFLILFLFILTAKVIKSQPELFDQALVDSLLLVISNYPDDTNKANAYSLLSGLYTNVNPEIAIEYASQGYQISKSLNYISGITNNLGKSAFIYAIQSDWPKSINQINEVLSYQNINPKLKIYMNNLMYLNEYTRGNGKEGIQWNLKSIHEPIFSTLSDVQKWPTYMQLLRGYAEFGDLDSAKYYGKLSYAICQKFKSVNSDLTGNTFFGLGVIEYKDNHLDSAIHLFHLANQYFGSGGDYFYIASIYHQLHKPDSVRKYADLQLKSAQRGKILTGILQASKLLAQHFEKTNPAKALEYSNLLISTQDSLYSQEKLKQLENLSLQSQRIKYDQEKKLIAQKNKYFYVALGSILILSFIFSGFLYKNIRSKQLINADLAKTLSTLQSTQSLLIQSEKMASLGELTAGIAHEIQNPLNFVNNFSDINKDLINEANEDIKTLNIQYPMLNAQGLQETLNDIKINSEKINLHGQRASSIVKSMLEHSRASSGKKELTDVNKLCDEFVRLSYHARLNDKVGQGLRAKDKSFECDYKLDLDSSLPLVNVVSQDIGRVILNLVNNAFQATSEKSKKEKEKEERIKENMDLPSSFSILPYSPSIQISTKNLGNKIEIIIHDNGSGIPDQIKDKIFQPFFTTKPTGEGTGLGLSLAYDIIKAYGGELRCQSKPGDTTFTISLPFKANG